MNGMSGYWISPEGKIIEAYDHLAEVLTKPRKYGLTQADIRKIDREEILIKVMKKDFLRVRYHPGQYTTFEFWGYDRSVLLRIFDFVKKMKMWDNDRLMISDVKTDKYKDLTVLELKQVYHPNPKKKKTKPYWQNARYEDIWHIRKRRG